MSARWVTLALSLLFLSACGVVQGYQGAPRGKAEVARIIGDYRVTAGAPVTVILRQVDNVSVSVGQNAVDVLPGAHRLLVDCRVATGEGMGARDTTSTSTRETMVTRHEIEVEVSAGQRYRLAADTAPGMRGCADVRLESAD